MADEPTNTPEFSVTELSGAIKRTLETAFARIRVRGEITEVKTYPSGHTYFSLKDEGGKIRAVIWKSAATRAGLKPENGVEVIATGRISAYGDRSEYQLIVERLEYAGEGALLARIDALRKRLTAEGLFDTARKQSIPMLPQVIGVITSPKGAVLHDIATTLARRFPRPLLLWPVPVQGEGAPEKIAAAIAGMDQLPAPGIPRPDVLIVARGGGSLEDLMAFNEEIVIRAAAACRLPLISAVGHETDTTLIDFVADRRAPTPTAAAEMAIPPRAELLADVAQKHARLLGAVTRVAGAHRLRLSAASSRLPDLPSLLGSARMRLDDRGQRLALALPNLLAFRRASLVAAERHIPDPRALIAARAGALGLLALRHRNGLLPFLHRRRTDAAALLGRVTPAPLLARMREGCARLEGLAGRLDGASYEAILARGFALVKDEGGHPIVSAASIRPRAALTLRFADGERNVIAADAPSPRQGALRL
ncbi:MAG TPA: exodeoxyribonuclease VII large subunit [Acetobacteraceae bacterium]|nr:exodeoxyribonuclease VII large subunit [Acetobacteraceae bacterium]